ncbi:hypothetical protein L1885_28675, partial [Streptomyces fuscigenes]|nr:hypothetical protein [Streptomyces fuscigenes]
PPRGMQPGGGSGAAAGPGTGRGGTDVSPPGPGASPSGTAGGAVLGRAVSYSTHGRDLTVRFWGGVCGTYSVTADESGTAVEVGLVPPRPKPGAMCPAMARSLERTVTLRQPVGDRDVIGAETGAKLPRTGS